MSPASAGFIRVEISGTADDAPAIREAAAIFADRWPEPVRVEITQQDGAVTAILTMPRNASCA